MIALFLLSLFSLCHCIPLSPSGLVALQAIRAQLNAFYSPAKAPPDRLCVIPALRTDGPDFAAVTHDGTLSIPDRSELHRHNREVAKGGGRRGPHGTLERSREWSVEEYFSSYLYHHVDAATAPFVTCKPGQNDSTPPYLFVPALSLAFLEHSAEVGVLERQREGERGLVGAGASHLLSLYLGRLSEALHSSPVLAAWPTAPLLFPTALPGGSALLLALYEHEPHRFPWIPRTIFLTTETSGHVQGEGTDDEVLRSTDLLVPRVGWYDDQWGAWSPSAITKPRPRSSFFLSHPPSRRVWKDRGVATVLRALAAGTAWADAAARQPLPSSGNAAAASEAAPALAPLSAYTTTAPGLAESASASGAPLHLTPRTTTLSPLLLHNFSFCIVAPSDTGVFSDRLYTYMGAGCIPVLFGDGDVLPFASLFNWPAFTIRLANRDAPHVQQILGRLRPMQLHVLRQALVQARRSFFYYSTQVPVSPSESVPNSFANVLETTLAALLVRRGSLHSTSTLDSACTTWTPTTPPRAVHPCTLVPPQALLPRGQSKPTAHWLAEYCTRSDGSTLADDSELAYGQLFCLWTPRE